LLIATLWLRSGEVVVLKWDDVDFPKKELTIQRAIRRGEFRKPKTGVRTIDIPDTMMNILEEYKKESKSKWLFPNPRGGENYSDAKFINQNYFQPLLKRLEIPYIGMYELKHTGISLTFAGGVEPDFIANHAGHTDKSTFLKYYAQFIKNEESIKKLDKVLDFNT
jgi:integrase